MVSQNLTYVSPPAYEASHKSTARALAIKRKREVVGAVHTTRGTISDASTTTRLAQTPSSLYIYLGGRQSTHTLVEKRDQSTSAAIAL